ncbi:MAG: hypothetical protein HOW73_01605 [Polyangiaceae bacterium]|nr:hypothetical protein [Polyangiaceae bacterium]
MSNWFIGVVVDPGGWYPDRVPAPPEGFKAFHPDDLHLTVAFLGNVGAERADAAWRALRWPTGPVEAELADIEAMGSPRRYSALSFLLDKGRLEIEGAIGLVRADVGAAAEVEPDQRPPKAHLTIARPSRNASPAVRNKGLAWAKTIELRGTPILLREVALYTWSEDRTKTLFRKVDVRSMTGG